MTTLRRVTFAFVATAVLASLAVSCSQPVPNGARGSAAAGGALTAPTPQAAYFDVVPWSCMVVSPFPVASCENTRSRIMQTRLAAVALSAPVSPTALTVAVSGHTVTLTWAPPTGGDASTSYVVEAGSGSGLVDLANFDSGNTALALTADGVPSGTYFVRVRAKNGGGVSAPSNEVVFTISGGPAACSSPPNPPTGLTAKVSGSTLILSWTAPGGGCAPTGFIIEAGSSSGLVNLATVNTGSLATSFTANGVGSGTYFVRLRASNAAGQSAASNEVTFAIGGPITPTACGVERWAVKTLADTDAIRVTTAPVATSIAALNALDAHCSALPETRTFAPEFQVYEVTGIVQVARHEDDQDYHIALADPDDLTQTIVVELADPRCASQSPFVSAVGQAQAQYLAIPSIVGKRVTVRGVGFYDFAHGQTGRSRSCIELHPIINISVATTTQTPTTPPTATTTAASSVTASTVTLNGTVNPNGLTTSAFFQWAPTVAYGGATSSQSGGGTTALALSAALTGLTSSTTYHYRVVATNGAGTASGADATFTTLTTTATPPTPGGTRIGATCRDGTLSNATGSGACSSHGGVSCWRYSDGSCRVE